eukprot:10635360-Prorocentrum_lima.AAC.1
MQRSRPPAARLSAIRVTKHELALRRDKSAESAALQQQALDKKDQAAKLTLRLIELDRDEAE